MNSGWVNAGLNSILYWFEDFAGDPGAGEKIYTIIKYSSFVIKQ